MIADTERALQEVVRIFEEIGISYMVSGSVASSIHGIARYTQDIDFVADAWTQEVWSRRLTRNVGDKAETRVIYVASPEDMALQKLAWFRLGGGISDRQWGDVTGILKVQAETLDYAYLHRWAKRLGLTPLLQQALDKAGIAPSSPDTP